MRNPFAASPAGIGDEADSVVVLGLGRFGRALALQLMEDGRQVLGVDSDDGVVQSLHGQLTQVARVDTTNEQALRQLAIDEFDTAVVGIGSHIESSILTASNLLGFGIERIWAKAISDAHGRILNRLGVPHVVFPEHDMGRRVAHRVTGGMQDFVEIDRGFALVTTTVPGDLAGRPLKDTDLRSRWNISVVAVKTSGGTWRHPSGDTVLTREDSVVVAGPLRAVERFSVMSSR